MADREIYEFGAFQLDVAEHSLREHGKRVVLKPKVFETLALLVRNAGHLLSKQELMARLWPDAVVDETNLNKNVWLIRRALGESGDSSEYIETVPRIGYRFIGAVRRIDPGPGPAAPVIPIAPEGLLEPAPASAPAGMPAGRSVPLESRRPRPRALSVAAILGIATVTVVALWRSAVNSKQTATAGSRPTISVLGFRNVSNRADLDWLATALSEMVQAELAPGSSYRLMPVETAERLRRDLSLERPGSLSAESLARLRRAAAVDEVVGGSYVASGGTAGDASIRIDVLVQDARTGETVASVTETGETSRLFELVSTIGTRLRSSLREPERPQPEGRGSETLPRDETALRLYSEGLRKLRDSDALGARDLLLEAVAAEPAFPLAHAALGRAFSTLGYEENARLELQQALETSRTLPRKDQLEIEAAYRAANKEWDKAISVYQELDRLSPGDLENGLRLAGAALNAARRQEALAEIRKLHRLPPPTGTDPRIDLLESRVLTGSDAKAALRAADRGLAESRARHERAVEANALLDRTVAMHTLGNKESANAEEAMRIFSEVGDLGGEARAAHVLGDIQFDAGDVNGARASYQRAIELSNRIGYVLEKAAAVASLSRIASFQGDSAEAERLILEANSIWRAVPDRRQLPWGLNALGSIRLGQGRLAEAEALHREALKMSRDSGDRGSYLHEGYSGLLTALAVQGRLDEASRLGDEALRASRDLADPSWIAQHAAEVGSLDFERGRLADAKRMFSEALEIRRKIGEYTVADSELLLARVRLEEGNAEEAGQLAQSASREFASADRKADQAGAEAAIAEAMLLLGRRDDAEKTVQSARALLGDAATADARVPVLLADARVERAFGRSPKARSEVEAANRLARNLAWKNLLLETRLAAAEVETAARSTSAAPDAVSLASDARSLGFERIARRADRLAGRKS